MNGNKEKNSSKTTVISAVALVIVLLLVVILVENMWTVGREKAVEKGCTQLLQIIGEDGNAIEDILGDDGVYGTNELIYGDIKLMNCPPSDLVIGLFENREIYYRWSSIEQIAVINQTYDLMVEKITELLGEDKIIYTGNEDSASWQYDWNNIVTVYIEPYSEPGDNSFVVSEYQITFTHQCLDIG